MGDYNRNEFGPYTNADQEWSKKLGRRGDDVSGEGQWRHEDFDPRPNNDPSERRFTRYNPRDIGIRNQQTEEYFGSPYDVGNYASHYDDREHSVKYQRLNPRHEEQTSMGKNFRGKGPRSYKRSDHRILDDVNDRLFLDPYIDASDVEVDVDNGDVILKGTVEDQSSKRRAEDIAETVPGVKNVENRLRVANTNERTVSPVRSNAREQLM
jgi:hypothetical protein